MKALEKQEMVLKIWERYREEKRRFRDKALAKAFREIGHLPTSRHDVKKKR